MSSIYIITGASRGIGFETAKQLAENGKHVLAVARSKEKLHALKEQNPKRISVLPLDITEKPSAQKLKDYLEQNSFTISGLIHNAGVLINKPFTELSDADWSKQIEVNMMAPVRLTRELLPLFEEQSHLLHIGSMGGFQGSDKFPGLSAYSVTKGTLSILTECLALELQSEQINVNCLCLGAVQTEMLNEAFPGLTAPVKPSEMGIYISDFIVNGHKFYNGKVLPVAVQNPS
jgi:short-subunit dehydrogenase